MNIVDKPLTDLQKKFARYYVEAKYGNQSLSNTECAIKAGYSADSAYQRAYELLTGGHEHGAPSCEAKDTFVMLQNLLDTTNQDQTEKQFKQTGLNL